MQRSRGTRGPGKISRVPVLGRIGERDAAVGFSLFVEEILQDGFGIDPDEFLPRDVIEDVDIPGVDAATVVHHCEMTDAFRMQTVGRPHHVCGIHGMNQVGDDAIHLRIFFDYLVLASRKCLKSLKNIPSRPSWAERADQ
jgi:hypothetical protein